MMSEYHGVVYATIGPWRFIGKVGAAARRRVRLWESRVRGPQPWSSTGFSDNQTPSPFAGRWLFGSCADVDQGAFRRLRERVLERAQRARRGIFDANGRVVDINAAPCSGRWDVDPISGARWPVDSVFAKNPVRPGDVRFPWEIDRLHQLVWYGQAWRYTKDAGWITVAIEQLEQVLGEAPFEHGIHWRDGLQLAVRLHSIVALADLCHDAPGWFHQHLNNAVVAHALALRRQISPHSEITNNHAIGEACALALAGLYLRRARYVRRALCRLKIEVHRQFYADGVPYEGTVPYIRFDLDFLVLLVLALHAADRSIPRWLLSALEGITASLAALADAEGRVPPIGDGDDGRVLRFDDEPYLTVNESLHVAGELLRKSFAPRTPSEGFALWLLGPASLAPTERVAEAVHLEASGLVHLRRRNLDVWLDCGPTGYGSRGPGGHGHNDTTAIVAHLDGTALLHDPGWYTYFGDTKMRDRLRSTAAHNTITIDGTEQARLGGTYEILDDCQPAGVRIRQIRDDLTYVSCGHTGYDRLGKGVTYRRRVLLEGRGPWRLRVTDRVRSAQTVNVEAYLGSDLPWTRVSDTEWYLYGGHRLRLRGVDVFFAQGRPAVPTRGREGSRSVLSRDRSPPRG